MLGNKNNSLVILEEEYRVVVSEGLDWLSCVVNSKVEYSYVEKNDCLGPLLMLPNASRSLRISAHKEVHVI